MENEPTFFCIELIGHILLNFPERIKDKDFIFARSELAGQTYTECSKKGMSHEEALYEAMDVLYMGLHYSPFLLIKGILEKEFGNILYSDEKDKDDFSMQMLELCLPLINQYPIQQDDFIGSSLEFQLYTKIIEKIHLYLEKNGML